MLAGAITGWFAGIVLAIPASFESVMPPFAMFLGLAGTFTAYYAIYLAPLLGLSCLLLRFIAYPFCLLLVCILSGILTALGAAALTSFHHKLDVQDVLFVAASFIGGFICLALLFRKPIFTQPHDA